MPASKLQSLSDYLDKIEKEKKNKTFFDETFVIGNITDEKKEKMKIILEKEKKGYIV